VNAFEFIIVEGSKIANDLLLFDMVKLVNSSTAMFDILTLVRVVSAFHKGKFI
jgi:hypothetical protein